MSQKADGSGVKSNMSRLDMLKVHDTLTSTAQYLENHSYTSAHHSSW